MWNKKEKAMLDTFKKENLYIVDLYPAFIANPDYASQYLPNGAHPVAAGNAVIAAKMYEAWSMHDRSFVDLNGSGSASLDGSGSATLISP
jgi:hypothetical protein